MRSAFRERVWRVGEEMLAMRNVRPTGPPVVRVSARAQAELRPAEALVFDWTRLALCCAVAGETILADFRAGDSGRTFRAD